MNLPEDPFVRELLPEFVDSWLDDIDKQYKQHIKTKNSNDLYRLAHTLKGSCFQFGLNNIAELGIELMGYTKDNDWEQAKQMEAKIKNAFIEVKNYLKELDN